MQPVTRRHRGPRTIPVGNALLTPLETGVLIGYALGHNAKYIADVMDTTRDAAEVTVSRVCGRIGIKQNHSSALAYALFHHALTLEEIYEEHGLIGKRRVAA